MSDSNAVESVSSIRGRVLVAGASGALGGRVARRLLQAGVPVRAVGRRADALEPLANAGAELVVGDLRDADTARRACANVTQVVTTMNNVMGTGDRSPVTTDRPAYRTLSHAVVEAGVQRWVHVSALGIGPDNPVDYFRVKHAVDEMITSAGVPWVLVQPSAFMETWMTTLFGESMRRERKVTLFGRGDRVSNFVALDDVAAVICAILADMSVHEERVPVGGPSTLTWLDAVAEIEQAYGLRVRRSFVPTWLLSIGRRVAGRFDEKVGRLMSLGYWSATTDVRCDAWEETARRFGVQPMSVGAYLAAERAALASRDARTTASSDVAVAS